EGAFGLTPADLHAAYRLPNDTSGTQTIALVDAYNDPTAESDLKTYSRQLGLPACTTANGCFEKVNQKGETANLPFPRTVAELEGAEAKEAEEAEGWGGEISLDIETAPATSPHVIAVGGTRLLTTAGGVWQSETVWNDEGEIEGVPKGYGAGGGGCS